ncbi:MAG TPA: response regulator transcription factor [Anaerolineae bacterium]
MSEQNRIRVLVVDDHAIVREGLHTLLEAFPDLEPVGEAANSSEAIRLCAERHPDVVLMDLVMPGMDGITAIHAIHSNFPDIKILALTNFNDNDLVKEALAAGALGYLLKNITADELAQAIRDAAAGKSTMAPEAVQALINVVTSPPPPGLDLTKREREVLALLVMGQSNRQIAKQLQVSPSTVKNHVSRILAKLGVSTRTEAATLALRYHLVNIA